MPDQINSSVVDSQGLTPPGIEGVDEADTQGWDDAANDLFPGLTKEEDPKGEQPKPPEGEQKTATGEEKPKGEEHVPDAAEQDKGAGDEGGEAGEKAPEQRIDRAALDTRIAQREAEKAMGAMRLDVRTKMFADRPTAVQDAQGNEIKSVDDLMTYNNPNTGKAFTREEAEAMLPRMQAELEKQITSTNKEVDRIAEMNVTLKDEADLITDEYGELLAYPELRDKLWNDYQKYLELDTKSGLITNVKMSLAEFYRHALEPYAELGRRLEAEENGKTEEGKDKVEDKQPGKGAAPKAPEAPAKTPPDPSKSEQRAKARADRSDIYGGGKTQDAADTEDEEWGKAAEAVFGPRSRYERK